MIVCARRPALPVPPFAHELLAARIRGAPVNVFLMAGQHGWRRARARQPPNVLLLPEGERAVDFDWSCARGLHITLVQRCLTSVEIREIGFALINAGAVSVITVGHLGTGPTFASELRHTT